MTNVEARVLSAVLGDKQVHVLLQANAASLFRTHRDIYDFILDYFGQNGAVPPAELVIDRFGDFVPETNVGSTKHHLEELRTEYLNDRLYALLRTGATTLSDGDARKALSELNVGIAEAMRQATLAKTPRAMLSRAICGIRKKSLIVNLPGSPKAVRECLEVILPVLPHAVEVMLKGSAECGQPARRLV